MTAAQKLGIIAGGGDLPITLAETCVATGRPFVVLALKGDADAVVERFPHHWISIGQVGEIVRLLKQEGCTETVLAGYVRKPDFGKLKVDLAGARLLPKVIQAMSKGDDALLKTIVGFLGAQGFTVIGAESVTASILADEGAYGRHHPTVMDKADIVRGRELLEALGPFDVGQAVVVVRGLVLAVEGQEGTDAMLARCATLPMEIRGTAADRKGVLVKAPKPGQELRVDLPTIGVATVTGAAAANLAGIALVAGAGLVLDRPAVVAAADSAGLFVIGIGDGHGDA